MSNNQLILKTNWRYYYKAIVWGIILLPLLVGLFILIYIYFRVQNQAYIVHDDRIQDRNSGASVSIDDIKEVRKNNRVEIAKVIIHDLQIVGSSSSIILRGIENASVIKESIDQLISFKKELKESEEKRNAVQIKQDPGSLERLNDLAGLLQEGLISYDDYLQERKKFEDK